MVKFLLCLNHVDFTKQNRIVILFSLNNFKKGNFFLLLFSFLRYTITSGEKDLKNMAKQFLKIRLCKKLPFLPISAGSCISQGCSFTVR